VELRFFQRDNVHEWVLFEQQSAELKPLFQALTTFATKFEFNAVEAEGCFAKALAKLNSTDGNAKTRKFILHCRFEKQGQFLLMGTLRTNNEF
jgi:hypothetical protein